MTSDQIARIVRRCNYLVGCEWLRTDSKEQVEVSAAVIAEALRNKRFRSVSFQRNVEVLRECALAVLRGDER